MYKPFALAVKWKILNRKKSLDETNKPTERQDPLPCMKEKTQSNFGK